MFVLPFLGLDCLRLSLRLWFPKWLLLACTSTMEPCFQILQALTRRDLLLLSGKISLKYIRTHLVMIQFSECWVQRRGLSPHGDIFFRLTHLA